MYNGWYGIKLNQEVERDTWCDDNEGVLHNVQILELEHHNWNKVVEEVLPTLQKIKPMYFIPITTRWWIYLFFFSLVNESNLSLSIIILAKQSVLVAGNM